MDFSNFIYLFSCRGTLETLMESSLQLILGTILVGFIVHLCLPFFYRINVRTVTLGFLGLIWLESVLLFNAVNSGTIMGIEDLNFFSHVPFFFYFDEGSSWWGSFAIRIDFSLGVDILSAFFIVLTTFLFFFSFLNINIAKKFI